MIARERILLTGLDDSCNNKWRCFTSNQIFNLNETPNTNFTYGEIKISQSGFGLRKRQCTVQMLTRAEGEQSRTISLSWYRKKSPWKTKMNLSILMVMSTGSLVTGWNRVSCEMG